jgi:hypothetical protein
LTQKFYQGRKKWLRTAECRESREAHNAPLKDGPALGSRIERMAFGQSGIGRPHDLLKFKELGEEAWKSIIDGFLLWADCRTSDLAFLNKAA